MPGPGGVTQPENGTTEDTTDKKTLDVLNDALNDAFDHAATEETENTSVSEGTLQAAVPSDEILQNGSAVQDGQGTAQNNNNPDANPPGPAEAVDVVAESTANMLAETQGERNLQAENESGEEDPNFDKLPVAWKEDEDSARNERMQNQERDAEAGAEQGDVQEWIELKKNIGKLREGELYKSVLIARGLKKDGKNPMPSPSGFTARAGRALSKTSSAASSLLSTGALVSGVAVSSAGIFSTYYKKDDALSKTAQIVSLTGNIVALVSTARNSLKKLKVLATPLFSLVYQKIKGKGGEETEAAEETPEESREKVISMIFTGVGLVGDLATLLSKAISICKSVMTIGGWKSKVPPAASKAVAYLTPLLNMTAQFTGLAVGTNDLRVQMNKYYKSKAKAGEDWRDIKEDIRQYFPGEDLDSWSDRKRKEKIRGLLAGDESRPPDERLSEKTKDKLAAYLIGRKKRSRIKAGVVSTGIGMISNLLGTLSNFGSVIATDKIYKAKTSEELSSAKQASSILGTITAATGIATVGAKLATSAGTGVAKKLSEREGKSSDLIKNRLWSRLDKLTEEENGLKGLENDLSVFKPGAKERAAEAVNSYQDTSNLFEAAGVLHASLEKAKNLKEFQKMLIAGW